MTRVLLTGASSLLGRAILKQLKNDSSISNVLRLAFLRTASELRKVDLSNTGGETQEELKSRILTCLSQCPKETNLVKDLAQRLGFKTKQAINPALYKLLAEGKVRKVQDTPPMWQLNTPYDPANSRSTPTMVNTSNELRDKTLEELKGRILTCLSQCPEKTNLVKDLAQRLGFKT